VGVLKLRYLSFLFFLFVSVKGFAADSEGPFKIRFELSPVWQSVNRVQIPSPGGTRFDFTSLGSGPDWNYRVDAAWRLGENSEIRALYAPLSLTLNGQLGSNVSFQDTLFSGSADTEGLYRFNSYRLTYRHRIVHNERFLLWIGITGKIRDAEIRLTQGGTSASRTNVGFVPLLHLLSSYQLNETLRLQLEIDALAAPQGRAEDIALLLAIRFLPNLEGFLGYRTVEGGSEGGGGVYNFAWLHYGVLGVGFQF
jgi:hypothetical protein